MRYRVLDERDLSPRERYQNHGGEKKILITPEHRVGDWSYWIFITYLVTTTNKQKTFVADVWLQAGSNAFVKLPAIGGIYRKRKWKWIEMNHAFTPAPVNAIATPHTRTRQEQIDAVFEVLHGKK